MPKKKALKSTEKEAALDKLASIVDGKLAVFAEAGQTVEEPVTHEAHRLINGARREAYGAKSESFKRVAKVWSAVLLHPVTPEQVALCMAGLKLIREAKKHGRDNCVDGAAYFELAHEVAEEADLLPKDIY